MAMSKFALMAAATANAEVMFKEDFESASLDSWTHSTWKSESEMEKFQIGKSEFAPAAGSMMKTTQDARFYGISKAFDKEFDNKDKYLTVQYEALQDKDVECGGAYLKMGVKPDDLAKFGDPTEYSLMFGPDKCGGTKRTHVIFNYKGKNVLKKVDLPYKQDDDGISTLYRLTVGPDNKVIVKVNDEEIYSGDMEEDWELLPSKEIDDPEDKKPSDWVDEAMMDDPEDKKPEDWVEIKEITDPEAKQPADWDAEEDGEWEAPMIPNPDFKGEWSAKRISNPAYKGVWAPKKITNPEYSEDKDLYQMAKKSFGFIGFDLWQVKAGTLFDNIIVETGKTIEEATKESDAAVTKFKDLVEQQKDFKSKTTTTSTTTMEASTEDDEDKDDDGEDAPKDDDL